MKKFLTIIGAITITASSASTVVACGNPSTKNNDGESDENTIVKSIREQSLNNVKASILADQFGLDKTKTNKVSSNLIPETGINYFNNSSVDNALDNLTSGERGADNLVLKKLVSTLEGIPAIGGAIKGLNLNDLIDKYGDTIKNLPSTIAALPVDAILQSIPLILDAASTWLKLPNIGQETLNWIAETIDANITNVIGLFDVKEALVEFKDKTIDETLAMGVESLNKTLELIFSGFKDKDNQEDPAFSAFLGKEILTKALNKQDIDKDKILNSIKNTTLLNIIDIVKGLRTTITSLMLTFNSFHEIKGNVTPPEEGKTYQEGTNLLVDKEPKDADHVFDDAKTNDEFLKEFTQQKVSINPEDISYSAFISDVINYLTNPDGKKMGILKFNNIMFHRDFKNNTSGSLMNFISDVLFRSIRTIDYKVEFNTKVDVPVLGTLAVDINFNVKDLMKPNVINIGKLKEDKMDLILKNKDGILIKKQSIVDLVEKVILNKEVTDKNEGKKLFLNLFNDDKEEFALVYGEKQVNLGKTLKTLWIPLANKIMPLFKKLYNVIPTMWYEDASPLLISLKIMTQEQIDEFKKKNNIKNFNISEIINSLFGSYLNMIKTLDPDAIYGLISSLLYENKIQDEPTTFKKGKKDSLIAQIIKNVKHLDKVNYYLGYVQNKDNNKTNEKKYTYVKRESVMGYLLKIMYPEISTTDDVIDLNNLNKYDQKNIEFIQNKLIDFGKTLQGEDLTKLITPIFNDEKSWTIKDIQNGYFDDNVTLMYETYTLEFNSGDKKGTYEVSFERTSETSLFNFKKITKIS